jgi:hypothetical protein
MSGRNSRRRQNYGRRQHDVRERRTRLDFSSDFPSWLLEAPGDAGGGELGADRLRRPDFEYDKPSDAA